MVSLVLQTLLQFNLNIKGLASLVDNDKIKYGNTGQNINKVFPGFCDKVKNIMSRSKSWAENGTCYIFEGNSNNVSIKRHLHRPTMQFY